MPNTTELKEFPYDFFMVKSNVLVQLAWLKKMGDFVESIVNGFVKRETA